MKVDNMKENNPFKSYNVYSTEQEAFCFLSFEN